MKKIPVGILGATGMVGSHYLQLLANHPWFEVAFLASSERSSGKSYGEATQGKCHTDDYRNMAVHRIDDISRAKECRVVFSALSTESAGIYEELFAEKGIPVISNASYHRGSTDVPVLIPEINPEHAKIIPIQQKNRGWERGFIAVKPNCSLQSYMIPLSPLHKRLK